VTGSSSGIGAALALKLSSLGCTLVLASRSGRTPCDFSGALSLSADVTRDEDVARLVRALPGGRLDVLVNNAGAAVPSRPSTMAPQLARECLELNYLAAVRVTTACLPFLRASGGLVVNVSSLLAHVPEASATQRASYAASKAALEAWSHALRAELAAEADATGVPRVDVSVVVPGSTATSFAQRAAEAAREVAFQPAPHSVPSALDGLPQQSVAEVVDVIVDVMLTRAPLVFTSQAVAAAARRSLCAS